MIAQKRSKSKQNFTFDTTAPDGFACKGIYILVYILYIERHKKILTTIFVSVIMAYILKFLSIKQL